MLKNRNKIIIFGGLFLGLIVRIAILFYQGSFGLSDILCYFQWGNRALDMGFAHGFRGCYFPIQWHIFEFSSWLVRISDIDYRILFRAMNLIFDLGCVAMLIAILKKMKCNPLFALIFWLHPWFIANFSSGYVDCYPAFFILLAVYLLWDGRTVKQYFWAGLPLGVAFLMKPQIQVIVVAAIFYAIAGYLQNRKLQRFALLIFPAALFIGYDIYFYFAVHYPSLGIKAIFNMADVYLHIQGLHPALSAYMLNFWEPVAYFVREPGAAIFVSSEKYLMPFVQYRLIGNLAALSLIAWYIFKINKRNVTQPENGSRYLLVFAVATTILPFIMTSAHENHFYMASMLLILVAAKFSNRRFAVSFHVILALLSVNLYLLCDSSSFLGYFKHNYNIHWMTVLSVISCVAFIFMIKPLVSFDISENNPGENKLKIDGKTGI